MEYIISVSLVAMVLMMIYFMVRAQANFWLIVFVIPWMLFTMGFGWLIYEANKGYASQKPVPTSQFLYAKVIGNEAFILIMSDDGPRLHVQPATDELIKQLQKGNQMVKGGKTVMVDGDDTEDTLRLHEFDHKKQFPKDSK
jgi:Ca2+/Na+ antiporter